MQFLEKRIPPPVVALIAAITIIVLSQFLPITSYLVSETTGSIFVFGLLILASCFLVPATRSFRLAKTTVNPLKPETAATLVTSGIYRYTRNPMYVGMVLILSALAVYLESAWCFVIVFLFGLYIQRFQIQPEEIALDAIFGEPYTHYKSRVRRWI